MRPSPVPTSTSIGTVPEESVRHRTAGATLRWAWRTLTSMRTAVILLVLLALTAVPGSLLPQRGVASDPASVGLFFKEHPDLAPWLDRLSLFDVYSAPWFAAIYLLLLVSMTGCVLPRTARLWRESRAAPPPAPRHLERELGHVHVALGSAAEVERAMDTAERHLRASRYSVARGPDGVRAEKGRVRELGNLAFHLSLLVLLVGVAGGRLFGYEGRVAVVEGETFSNVAASYDALSPAPWADLADLEPLELTLEEFEAVFEASGVRAGEPRAFDATVTFRTPTSSGTSQVRPNQPLEVAGTKFFLTGHGYAPEITVTDGSGAVAYGGPTIFLPADNSFTSDGVVKVPDALPAPIALEARLLPTAPGPVVDLETVSTFPALLNPRLIVRAYTGDLGLDDGTAQSVFALDLTDLTPVRRADGQRWTATLAVGESVSLPGGLGSVGFDGLRRFANFQVARDPGKEISLVAAVLLLAGLTTSLGVRRRRLWVRPDLDGGIEIAARSLSRREPPAREIASLVDVVRAANQSHPDRSAGERPDVDRPETKEPPA